jgi:hypothetical protein
MNPMNPLLRDLQVNYDANGRVESETWFHEQVRVLLTKNITPDQMMRIKERLTLRPVIGKMYCYIYDPKLKATLPYYDTFPLVLPFKLDRLGFTGLNLHYLPYGKRMELLSNLFNFATNRNMDERTKIITSWQLLQNSASDDLVRPCVKRYLTAHVKSPYLRIDATEWPTVAMLPLDRFKKASADKVWKESMDKVNNG